MNQVAKELELLGLIRIRSSMYKELAQIEDSYSRRVTQLEDIKKEIINLKNEAKDVEKYISQLTDNIFEAEMEIGNEY